LKKKTGEVIIIAIDEANVIVDTDPNWNSSNDKQASRPLCTLIVSAFSFDIGNACPVLLLGTYLGLKDFPRISSPLLKDPTIPLENRCEFDVFTMDDNMSVLKRLFPGMEHIDCLVIANKLQNLRARVLMKFCDFLIQDDNSLLNHDIDPCQNISIQIQSILLDFYESLPLEYSKMIPKD
jgi:hypothetical protein